MTRALVFFCVFFTVSCELDPLTENERVALEEMLLQPLPASTGNAFADDPDAARLGRALFFDAAFSGPLAIGLESDIAALGPLGRDGLVSCASCHDPAAGGADARSPGAVSLGAGFTVRHAPTVINAAYSPWQFWDGRKDSLWSQALGPFESAEEHNTSRLHVARVVYDHYKLAYERVFGALPDLDDPSRFFDTRADAVAPSDSSRTTRGRPGDAVHEAMDERAREDIDTVFANVGKAIEAYERQLVDKSSAFDRFMHGEHEALSESAIRGAKLFVGRASCNECHRGPALADNTFRNHGVPQSGERVLAIDLGRAQAIEQVLVDPFNGAGVFSDDREAGAAFLATVGIRASVRDVGAFKVPTLRNVARTAPYMHTGALDTLWDVVEFYAEAAGTDGFAGELDASVAPIRLSDEDVADLVSFMEALNGEGIEDEWLRAPVGETAQ